MNDEAKKSPEKPIVSATVCSGAVMNYRYYISIILSLVVLAGCDFPSDSSVKTDFLKEHPKYTVVTISPGEGDEDTAYYHIHYQKPGSDILHEEVWLYPKPQKSW